MAITLILVDSLLVEETLSGELCEGPEDLLLRLEEALHTRKLSATQIEQYLQDLYTHGR